MKKLFIILLIFYSSVLYAESPTGKDILEKIDKNLVARSRVSTSTMIIKGRRGTRTVKAKTWAEGIERGFTEYLAPAREKGTKMLKIKDELWTWTPSTDRIIKIAGHMLRQSMLGSDISYEDFMEDPILSNTYDSKISGEEDIDGRPCYILDLRAKEDNVAYSNRILWVDKERYVALREDLFAKSGNLLKTLRIKEVFKIDNRWYPKRMIFKDVLKKGSGTELIIDSIEFNLKIPSRIFSKASLRR
ncbi:MAG: outer membrane lipoprotein-sorting protein [bacterium]